MSTASLLVTDEDLTPSEWLRRFALTRLKYSAPDRDRLLEIAAVMRSTEITRDAMEHHLESIAVAIKGEPEPDCVWGWDDLPELVTALVDKVGRPDAAVH